MGKCPRFAFKLSQGGLGGMMKGESVSLFRVRFSSVAEFQAL